MKIVKFAAIVVICLTCCQHAVAQTVLRNILNPPRINSNTGIHSGSWTLQRAQLLEAESQDPHRSCLDPYCARCARHLADYGHEFQLLGGPSQRQPFYRSTVGSVAVITQRGFEPQSNLYLRRGQPAAVMSREYVQALNHAIQEQVNARNAVAAEEAAFDRIVLLTQLLEDATEQLRLTREAWEEVATMVNPCHQVGSGQVGSGQVVSGRVVASRCTKTFRQFSAEMRAGRFDIARQGFCVHCLANAQYQFDQAYVADVERELALARLYWERRNAIATEAVRVALLSKRDADLATRFLRIQYKQPRLREVLAARGVDDLAQLFGSDEDEE